MGKITGFLEFERLEEPHEPTEARKKHYREFYLRLSDEDAAVQGARCMDCGIPFCMSGGLLRYGIPDFKLEKGSIDRRIEQMREEGVKFRPGVFVGTQPPGRGIGSDARESVSPEKLKNEFDAVVLAGGAEQPRDLPIPG